MSQLHAANCGYYRAEDCDCLLSASRDCPTDGNVAEIQPTGTDARVWARCFVQKFGGQRVGKETVDNGLLIGWFSNAIMT